MKDKEKIQEFWGDLYKQWYELNDSSLSPERLNEQLDAVEKYFKMRGQLVVREMPYYNLKEKKVLEIGCGGGAHSALFKGKGANVTAVDLTAERVNATALKFKMIPGKSKVLQADAEQLPFAENTFDIVYSNGVLHHSQNTEKCVAEA